MSKKPQSRHAVADDVKNTKKSGNILTRFFSHNITLMVLSFVLAFTIWIIINVSSQTNSKDTISGIPVTLGELSEEAQNDGLEIFMYDEDVTAEVEVSGNRITVGSLTSSDITVTFDARSIITSGEYTLPLEASKSGSKNNYEISSSVEPSSVKVYVDKRGEEVFTIENLLVPYKDSTHEGYATLSRSSVKVTGPVTYVKQIDRVVVEDSIMAITDENRIVERKLKFLDADGHELVTKLLKPEVDTVDVTVNVWPTMNVNLAVEPVKAPKKNCPSINLSPSIVKIAAPQNVLDQIENNTVKIDTLDFSTLTNKMVSKTIDFTIEGCKLVNPEKSQTTLSVDLSSYQLATAACKITTDTDTIDLSKYTVSYDKGTVSVRIYGPESLVNSIDSTKITVKADFSGRLDTITDSNPQGSIPSVPLKVTLPAEYDECWVYGTYSVNANVSLK